MRLSDHPHEAALRASVRDWLASRLDDARRQSIEAAIMRGESGPARAWQRELFAAGYAVRSWPRVYGGGDGALAEDLILFEELARAEAPDDIFRVGIRNVGPVLMRLGSAFQKEQLLRGTADGTILWSQGFSEPGAGSDLASLQSRARLVGGRWVLRGQKVWNTFGHMADWCLFLMRTGVAISRHRGLSAFVVPMNTPGISVRPIPQMSGRTDFNEVFLDDVEVDSSSLVGEEGDGWKVAVAMLDFERRGLAAIGFDCLRTYRRLVRLATTLRTAGGGSLSKDPQLRRRLAELGVQVRIAVLNNHRFAAMVPPGQPPGPEASVQKLHATELNKSLHGFAMELLMENTPHQPEHRANLPKVSEAWLGSFGFTIGGGTAQVQRNIIAERVLDLPR
ncbi:acyl-CoA dehydrogenase [Ramlibacter sp. RBP-2]|uniref:Acyl-CoA dehydrogenase n=1 Tax=Ramlibacter lithotrophicus TaxID=2606681 RepID=A0A7X6DKK0_9BURK|nr:acyl-CoA dehydrogenase family protein [Ramlibacter lithotrophicus]NKE68892.1 acyl-CoA dehydrogenase [Ramlibacter lithotrophicus]